MPVKVTWVGGNAFAARSESGHWAMMDSAPDGASGAPSPMEYLIMGLGGCTGIDLVAILRKMRQQVTGIELEIHSERAQEHPRVFTRIHLKYRVRGRGMSPERVRSAVELSEDKYCSVAAMLRESAELTYEVEVIEEG